MPEAAATIVAIELLHNLPINLLDTLHDELRDAITAVDLKLLVGISVEQDHFDLAAICRIDQPGRVGDGEPMAKRIATSRQHEARIAKWNGNADARRHQQATTIGRNGCAFASMQVETGIANVCIGG